MLACSCPIGDFPKLTDCECKSNFGQVQKLIFVRLDSSDFTTPSRVRTDLGAYEGCLALVTVDFQDEDEGAVVFVTDESPDGMILSSGDTVITPFVSAPEQEAGEARTFGGGNDTPDGIEEYLGTSPSTFTFRANGWPQSVIKQLKEFVCFAQSGLLGVYFINGEGKIEGIYAVDENDDKWLDPIPVRSMTVTDKVHGNYDEPDNNIITITLDENYSEHLVAAVDTNGINALDIQN